MSHPASILKPAMQLFSSRRFRSHWLERRILLVVMGVVHRPRLVLICSAVLLAASIVLANLHLSVSSDDDKLFSDKLVFRRDYHEFDSRFPENDALYIIVEKKPEIKTMPELGRWTAAADAIVARIHAVPAKFVESVDARVPLDQLGSQALLFEDTPALRPDLDDAKRFSDLAKLWAEKSPSIARVPPGLTNLILGKSRIGRFLSGFAFSPDTEGMPLVQSAAKGWLATITQPNPAIVVGGTVSDLKQLGADDPGDLGYYWQPDYKPDPGSEKTAHLLLVRVYPHMDYSTMQSTAEPVDAIREALKPLQAEFPEFKIGATGRPAIDADEMAQTDHDSHVAETVAAIVVFVGLWVLLRSLWLALTAEIALGVGIGWTFGWATLVVGRLNLLSIVFLIALIGIGMDYLVQILMRYRSEARRFARPKAIWARVFKHVSAPINTACLGAAWAFLVSIFTKFQGAEELGIIAGGGLLLCLLAGYTVLPAILTLFPPKLEVDVARRPSGILPKPLGAKRLIPAAIWICLIGCLSPYAFRVVFNSNVLDLQAPNLESVRLVKKLQPWSSVIMSKDLAKLAEIRKVLPADQVSDTDSILDTDDNYNWLLEHQSELPNIDWSIPDPIEPADLPAIADKAKALADRLAGLPKPSVPADAKRMDDTVAALRQFAGAIPQHDPNEVAARLTKWQNEFIAQMRTLLEQFHPKPLDRSKVPPEMLSHYISADGTYALYINPRPELDLWSPKVLAKFVQRINEEVKKVPGAPPVTGIAHNVYYTTREVGSSFKHATAYALLIILFLVLIDLRSITHTLLAVSVLGLGLPILIELMGLLNISWNFANFFGLPILIGAGHEYGVFLIHRYRESLRDPRRVWRFWDVADRALFLCFYITSSSFGFFWFFSNHRGLKSLGLVMALGTACIYLSAVLVLRPVLLWRLERNYGIRANANRGFEVVPKK